MKNKVIDADWLLFDECYAIEIIIKRITVRLKPFNRRPLINYNFKKFSK